MGLVMDRLGIAPNARPAMLALSKAQKITMIQQYYDPGSRHSSQPPTPKRNSLLAPSVMAKNISAPSLMSAPPTNIVSLSEAKQKLKGKHRGLHRLHGSNSLSKIPNLKPSVARQLHESRST